MITLVFFIHAWLHAHTHHVNVTRMTMQPKKELRGNALKAERPGRKGSLKDVFMNEKPAAGPDQLFSSNPMYLKHLRVYKK